MTDQQTPPAPTVTTDLVTAEWVDSHLPGVFASGHRWLVGFSQPTSEALIAAAGIQPGMHVVDIASGSGIPTLEIARHVGPTGRVAAVDPSAVLIEALTENVRAAGLGNVDIVQASVTAMPFPPASFDAATCHFGAMFFPDLHAGLEAIRRVLRPGGRAAFAGWGALADNTMLAPFFGTMAKHLGPPPPSDLPPSERPWPMRFAEPGTLTRALASAGYSDIQEDHPVMALTWPGPPETLHTFWLQMANFGEEIPAATREAVASDLLEALRATAQPDGLHFTARIAIASARAPA